MNHTSILILILLIFYFNNYIFKKKIEKMTDIELSDDQKAEIAEKCVLQNYDFNYEAFNNLGKITGIITWEDSLRLPLDVKANKLNLLAKGMIITYSPTQEESKNISTLKDNLSQKGWGICDGSIYNGIKTPNLVNKFIYGSDSSKGLNDEKYRKDGNKIGEEKVALNINNMPRHNHGGKTDEHEHKHYIYDFVAHNNDAAGNAYPTPSAPGTISSGYFSTWSFTNATLSSEGHAHNGGFIGENILHNNMPPYLKFIYIMKL